MNLPEVKVIGVLLIAACICFAIAAFQKAMAADDGFMAVTPPVNAGDTLVEAISEDPIEYVKLGTTPNAIQVKLYGKGCSKIVGFSETEIYNWRACPDGTITPTDGSD